MRCLVAVAVALLAACSSATGSTTTVAPGEVSCEDPPSSEVEATSALDMTVDPNPATVRETVDLAVSSEGLPADALAGVDARWQCWDGSEWITTHAVYRGFANNSGQTIPVNDEFQIMVPSIGLELDQGYPIVIPQVEPGIYRIEDEIIVDGDPVPGFVIVEVVEG